MLTGGVTGNVCQAYDTAWRRVRDSHNLTLRCPSTTNLVQVPLPLHGNPLFGIRTQWYVYKEKVPVCQKRDRVIARNELQRKQRIGSKQRVVDCRRRFPRLKNLCSPAIVPLSFSLLGIAQTKVIQ